MWLLVAREPRQDAPQWSGRKSLAVLDALAWPVAAVSLITLSPLHLGVVGPVLMAAVLWLSVSWLHRAIWMNHRYRFTTWRWGGVALGLIMVGAILKMVA